MNVLTRCIERHGEPVGTAVSSRCDRILRAAGSAGPRLGRWGPAGDDARRADLLAGRRYAATGCATDCDGDCDVSRRPVAGGSGNSTDDTDPEPDAGSGPDGARLPAGPGKPLVQVTVPITMLMGLDEQPGELAGHGPIPASLAREIAAGGTWRRLLTDPHSGVLLDHGRTTYTPPAGLADFVRARDVVCRFCTCGQPAARADLDHTVAYADGGPTSDRNLYAGCRHHHLGKTHAPGWHVDQHNDGRITWTTPIGHLSLIHI